MFKKCFRSHGVIGVALVMILSVSSCKHDNVLATSADRVSNFIQVGKVERTGNIREVWIKKVAAADKIEQFREKEVQRRLSNKHSTDGYNKYLYTLDHYQFDCDAHKYRIVVVLDYDTNGNVLTDDKMPETDWLDLVPQTVGDAIAKRICGE